VFRLDVALYAMVTLASVISLQAVGNILVLAPAACTIGLYLSYWFNLAAGGLIVLVVTGLFLLSWLLPPGTACSPAGVG